MINTSDKTFAWGNTTDMHKTTEKTTFPREYATENYANQNVLIKTSDVWAVLTPQGHILGIYTSRESTWNAIAEIYRKSETYRKCDLRPRRITLDTWLGD